MDFDIRHWLDNYVSTYKSAFFDGYKYRWKSDARWCKNLAQFKLYQKAESG